MSNKVIENMTWSGIQSSINNADIVIRFKDRDEAIAAICARLFGAKPVYDEDDLDESE